MAITSGERNKPKVLQVLYSGLGGHGSVFTSLVEGDEHNQVQHAAIFYGIEPMKAEYLETCRKNNISFQYIAKGSGLDLASMRKVFKAFATERPDVIVLHSLNLLPVALLYTKTHKCRLIVVEHSSLLVKTRYELLLSKLAMQLAPTIVVLTEEYARQLQQALGNNYKPAKVKVINNGVDTDRFSPKNNASNPNELVLSMQSRFSASSKDHVTLVKAFDEVLKKYTGSQKIKMILAGDGETLSGIKELTAGLGREKEIEFPGMLPEHDIVALLQRSDIYVHSSIAEAMSTAVMQAMACGTAVVASDIPGINNMVRHGENGLLFPKGNQAALEQSILSLLDNAEERLRLGASARSYAVAHLSHRQMFRAYYRLYTA